MKTNKTLSLATVFLPLVLVSQGWTSEALATANNDASSSSSSSSSSAVASKVLRTSADYHLLEVVPHDISSFTQGLTYFDGYIYEGTGMEYQSHLLRHDPANRMKTLDKIPLTPTHLFGEGISHYYIWKTDKNGNPQKEHRLIQLTWKHKLGKIYSLPKLQLIQEFTFDTSTGEGWGITFIPHRNEFYVSDGSENLIVWDAETLVEKRRIVVTFEREPGTIDVVKHVNELEFVNFAASEPPTSREKSFSTCMESGICTETASTFTPTMKILANVWYQDVLISIDPETGRISRVFDLRDIYPIEQRDEDGADCLNGISVTNNKASDEDYKGLDVWVTGKLWPKMYRIRLIE